MFVRYWSFIQVPKEIYEENKKTFEQIQDGNLKSSKFEILWSHSKSISLFSLRTNRGDRLTATTVLDDLGKRHLLILEKTHHYHLSNYLNKNLNDEALEKKIQQYLLKNQDNMVFLALDEEISEQKSKETRIKKLNFVKTYFFNGKCIEFSDEQEAAAEATTKMPVILSGEAGTGKTCVLKLILDKLTIKQPGENSKRLLYITTSERLIKKMKKMCAYEVIQERHTVDFLTHQQLLEQWTGQPKLKLQTKVDFALWFSTNRKRFQNEWKANKGGLSPTLIDTNPDLIYQEFRILCGCESQEEYKDLGDKVSLFSLADREQLFRLYNHYEKYLEQNNKIDAAFYAPKIENQYAAVLLDEGQDLSTKQLKLLFNLAANNQVFYSLGYRQNLQDCRSRIPFLRQLGFKKKRPFFEIKLTHPYRCPPNVVRLVNEVIAIGNELSCGSAHKQEPNVLKNIKDNTLSGNVIWVKETDSENMQKVHTNLAKSAKCKVIVMDEKDKQKAIEKEKFKKSKVITAAESRGLEYDCVIFYLTNIHKFKSSNEKLLPKATNNPEPHECDIILMSSPPDINNLSILPIKSKAYIRSRDQLFYVNKVKKESKEINISKKQIEEFDQKLNPTHSARALLAEELITITLITEHSLPEQEVKNTHTNRAKRGRDKSDEYALLWNTIYTILTRSRNEVIIITPANEHNIENILTHLRPKATTEKNIMARPASSQTEWLKDVAKLQKAGNFSIALDTLIENVDNGKTKTAIMEELFREIYQIKGETAAENSYKEISTKIAEEDSIACRAQLDELKQARNAHKNQSAKTQTNMAANNLTKTSLTANKSSSQQLTSKPGTRNRASYLKKEVAPSPKTPVVQAKEIQDTPRQTVRNSILSWGTSLQKKASQLLPSSFKDLAENKECKIYLQKIELNWKSFLENKNWVDLLFNIKEDEKQSLLEAIQELKIFSRPVLFEILKNCLKIHKVSLSNITGENIQLIDKKTSISLLYLLSLNADQAFLHELFDAKPDIAKKITMENLCLLTQKNHSAFACFALETNSHLRKKILFERLLELNPDLLQDEENLKKFAKTLCGVCFVETNSETHMTPLYLFSQRPERASVLLQAIKINPELANYMRGRPFFAPFASDKNWADLPFYRFTEHVNGIQFLSNLLKGNSTIFDVYEKAIFPYAKVSTSENSTKTGYLSPFRLLCSTSAGIELINVLLDSNIKLIKQITIDHLSLPLTGPALPKLSIHKQGLQLIQRLFEENLNIAQKVTHEMLFQKSNETTTVLDNFLFYDMKLEDPAERITQSLFTSNSLLAKNITSILAEEIQNSIDKSANRDPSSNFPILDYLTSQPQYFVIFKSLLFNNPFLTNPLFKEYHAAKESSLATQRLLFFETCVKRFGNDFILDVFKSLPGQTSLINQHTDVTTSSQKQEDSNESRERENSHDPRFFSTTKPVNAETSNDLSRASNENRFTKS